MEQSQLVELIRTLDADEKQIIRQFVRLPYFNQGKMRSYVPILLDFCLEHPWDDPNIRVDKKTVFALIFPGQTFVEGKLEKVMVEVSKTIRLTLLVQNYLSDENEFSQGLDYAILVRKRGLDERFQQLISRLEKTLHEIPWKNADQIHHQYLLAYAIHDRESLHNFKKGDLNIPNVLESLDLHGHINRLALVNRFLQQQKIARIEIPESQIHLLDDLPVPAPYLAYSPVLAANYAISKLLRKERPDPADIRSLFELLQFHDLALDPESKQEFYTYLRNICIIVLSADVEKIEIEHMLHDLYRDNLQRGFLHYDGKLIPSRFWAVSSNALRVKNFSWALEFIEQYKKDLIGENETQDIYRLNMANYLFALGRYSECLDFIPPTSPFADYMLAAKRLEIMAYYELGSDLLHYKLEAFKVFLSRTSSKIYSEAQKQIYLDFSNLLTQICTSPPGDIKRAERVIQRIQAKKQAAEWRWLHEKASALKS